MLLPRSARRVLSIFIAAAGLILVVFPFAYFVMGREGPDLIGDTQGYFGAGTPTRAHVATVRCRPNYYGTNTVNAGDYDCLLGIRDGTESWLERTTSSDLTGSIPTLRVLSSNPTRYAVLWGGGTLLYRWFRIFTVHFVVILGMGIGCLWVARYAWKMP
ncbi:MAG: hypothetical protein ABI972_22915 [Acidobacteriota bacterium]